MRIDKQKIREETAPAMIDLLKARAMAQIDRSTEREGVNLVGPVRKIAEGAVHAGIGATLRWFEEHDLLRDDEHAYARLIAAISAEGR